MKRMVLTAAAILAGCAMVGCGDSSDRNGTSTGTNNTPRPTAPGGPGTGGATDTNAGPHTSTGAGPRSDTNTGGAGMGGTAPTGSGGAGTGATGTGGAGTGATGAGGAGGSSNR